MILYNCRCCLLQRFWWEKLGGGVESTELCSFTSLVKKQLLHRLASGFQHLKHYFSSTARVISWKNYDPPWASQRLGTRDPALLLAATPLLVQFSVSWVGVELPVNLRHPASQTKPNVSWFSFLTAFQKYPWTFLSCLIQGGHLREGSQSRVKNRKGN